MARAVDWLLENHGNLHGRYLLPSIMRQDDCAIEKLAKIYREYEKDHTMLTTDDIDAIRLHTSFEFASRHDMYLMIEAMDEENVPLNIMLMVISTYFYFVIA